MPSELIKDYIGRTCIITMSDDNNTQSKGIVVGIENNWIKIKDNNMIRIINGSSIKDIIINDDINVSSKNDETINDIKEHDVEIYSDNKKENKIEILDSVVDAVVLTHGNYWYRAYNDSAYVLSFITDYKLYEDTQTKRPTVGFPIDSIDNVLNLLQKYKINYYLKYENVYKDFGEENNFQRFLHKDLPFSYVKSNQIISKPPKGRFVVQYEGEKEEEFIIGNNISEDAELTKNVENSNVGDTITINQFNIKVVEKEIYYE